MMNPVGCRDIPSALIPSSAIRRFWEKLVIKPFGCWDWQDFLTKGYGSFYINGRIMSPHRFAFIYLKGTDIPKGLDLDHLCRNRGCVNPQHLEVVTRKENLRRGGSLYRFGTCERGHPLNEENIYWRKDRPRQWNCLQCRRESRAKARITEKGE